MNVSSAAGCATEAKRHAKPANGILTKAGMINSSVLPPVMPAQADIHDLPSLQQRKSWTPACAGMTGVAARASMFRAATNTSFRYSAAVPRNTSRNSGANSPAAATTTSATAV